jgi:23S rRNA pseudouridine2605 synthase
MREGKNREVKNVLGHLGLQVNRLIRVSFGPFQLGALPEGAVEEVRTRILREQLGEKVAALAGVDFTAPITHVALAHDGEAEPGAPRVDRKPRQSRSSVPGRPRKDAQAPKPGARPRPSPRSATHKRAHTRRSREAERFGEPALARREKRNRHRRPRPPDREPAR